VSRHGLGVGVGTGDLRMLHTVVSRLDLHHFPATSMRRPSAAKYGTPGWVNFSALSFEPASATDPDF